MLTALLFAATALAQDPAYDRTAKEIAEAEKPVTALSAEFGGTFTSGNAFALAFNGGVSGKHDWKTNRFTFGTGVNLNLAKIDTNADGTLDDAERDAKLTFTSQRVFGAARYDRFFGKLNSIYVSAGVDRDIFAGLEWRFNQQIGYSRALVNSKTTDLDLEAGFAYTQENFKETVDADGAPVNDAVLDAHYPAIRVFLGFEHRFNDRVSIGDTVDMNENLRTTTDFRLVNTAFLATKLSDKLSLKLSHRLAFDNEPASDAFRKLDQTTQLTLVASIF